MGPLTAGPKPQAACAGDIARFLEECPHDRIAVEEQDHDFYIIHISNEPTIIWVFISSQSPIFLELRSRHAQCLAEHPKWLDGVLTWDTGGDVGLADLTPILRKAEARLGREVNVSSYSAAEFRRKTAARDHFFVGGAWTKTIREGRSA